MSAADRIKRIEEFVASKAPGARCTGAGNFYSGPYTNRKMFNASYAEFGSQDAARDALTAMKDSEFTASGATIRIKQARSKLNGQRNVSIRKAEELIKAHGGALGQETKINWATSDPRVRTVTVNDTVAFCQGRNVVVGIFQHLFDDLVLP